MSDEEFEEAKGPRSFPPVSDPWSVCHPHQSWSLELSTSAWSPLFEGK